MRLNQRVAWDEAAELVATAIADTGRTLKRLPGRAASSGLLEVRELGPALRASLVRAGIAEQRIALEAPTPMADWNRPTSEVDLVVHHTDGLVEFAAELKVWDVGHQLFDAAKACCLLTSGVPAAFLICVAKRPGDFDRMPGGELFPLAVGEVREHDFGDLIVRRRDEWQHHVGHGGPEPTSVPARFCTRAVSVDAEIKAYPGHCLRAVEVAILDAAPVSLSQGWPANGQA